MAAGVGSASALDASINVEFNILLLLLLPPSLPRPAERDCCSPLFCCAISECSGSFLCDFVCDANDSFAAIVDGKLATLDCASATGVDPLPAGADSTDSEYKSLCGDNLPAESDDIVLVITDVSPASR